MTSTPSAPAHEAVTGVVVAGGKSTRFGTDKASALVAGRSLLEWVVNGLAAACEAIVVVRAAGQSLPPVTTTSPMTVVDDEYEERGPLAGLVAGFASVGTPLAFAASCDVPLVRSPLVNGLAALARECDVVVPHVEGFPQPLLAVYRPAACLPRFRHAVELGQLKITTAYSGLRVRVVREPDLEALDPGLLSFRNVNRVADLEGLAAELSSRT